MILFTGGGGLVPGGFLQFFGGFLQFLGGLPIFRGGGGVPPIFRGGSSNFSGGVWSGGFLQFFGGFLQFFGGGGSSNFSGGVCCSGTPPGQQTPEYGQLSAGTHPTGMHSCCIYSRLNDSVDKDDIFSLICQSLKNTMAQIRSADVVCLCFSQVN